MLEEQNLILVHAVNAFSRCPKVVSPSGGIAGMSFSLPYEFGTIFLSLHVGMSNKISQILCIRPTVPFHEKSRKLHLKKPLLRQYQCCKYKLLKFICANYYFILSDSLGISEKFPISKMYFKCIQSVKNIFHSVMKGPLEISVLCCNTCLVEAGS